MKCESRILLTLISCLCKLFLTLVLSPQVHQELLGVLEEVHPFQTLSQELCPNVNSILSTSSGFFHGQSDLSENLLRNYIMKFVNLEGLQINYIA